MEHILSDEFEGTAELKPMTFTWSHGQANEYPLAVPLFPVPNYSQLLQEYRESVEKLSPNYLLDRAELLPASLFLTETVLAQYGFDGVNYTAHSFHEVGKTNLVEAVGIQSKEFIEKHFESFARVHYAAAKPNWSSTWHRDCWHFKQHGFRIHIPLSAPAHYHFLDAENRLEKFVLDVGWAWFVNIAYLHKSFNPSQETRVSILLQMMTDRLLRDRQRHA